MNRRGTTLLYVLIGLLLVDEPIQCKRTKYILLQTSLASPCPNWHLGKSNIGGPQYFKRHNYPETHCIVTSNKTYLPSPSDYDVIALNSWDIPSIDVFPPPSTRHPNQIYAIYYHESPSRTKQSLSQYSNMFNWTMSFRLDADVVIPYGHFFDINTKETVSPFLQSKWRTPNYNSPATQNEDVMALVESKSKMAAWFVSSCYSPSQRKYVVQKMQEYIPVDIYGKCGTLSCDKKEKSGCRDMVEKDYKFYLSFENSLCTDYVTEKVFDMMKYYVIPVVYGGADYTRFLPPGSYLNVLDYASVADLVNHMHYLANNIEEYMKYFWWKDYYDTIGGLTFCSLCEKITKVGEKPNLTQYYDDVDYWFKNGTCLEPENVPLVRETLIQYRRIKV